jgi:pimeloyl-ACP methyl ester carboxylesterase
VCQSWILGSQGIRWHPRQAGSILRTVFVEVDGLRINVEQSGAGPPLLLLHGWGASARSFASLMPAFASAYAVTAVDFPGFGLSVAPPIPWGVGDYADFVLHVLHRLRLERVHVLGHSLGGRVSIALAAAHPEVIDRMVLADAAGIRPPRTMKLKVKGLVARTGRRMLGHRLLGAAGQRGLRTLYERLGMSDYANAGPLRATFVKIVNEDLSESLPKIRASTLVIWGSRDEETPLWMGKQMAASIPDARLAVLEGGGHFAFLDQPAIFREQVLAFLQADAG